MEDLTELDLIEHIIVRLRREKEFRAANIAIIALKTYIRVTNNSNTKTYTDLVRRLADY